MAITDSLERIETTMCDVTMVLARIEGQLAKPAGYPVELAELVRMFHHIKGGTKIEAIMLIRKMTGCSLKEAKDTVEILTYERE